MVEKGQSFGSIPSSTGLLAAAGPSPGIEALELWPKTSSVKQASNALMAALLATFRSFWKFLFLITSDIGFFFLPNEFVWARFRKEYLGWTDRSRFRRGCIMTTKSTEMTFQIIRQLLARGPICRSHDFGETLRKESEAKHQRLDIR